MTAKRHSRLLATILMVCAALVTACTSDANQPKRPSASSLNAYSDTQTRRNYQVALNRSNDRIASNVPSIVEGRLYVAERKTGKKFLQDCTGRCATVVRSGDGYHLTLPVGFTRRQGSWQLTTNTKDYRAVPVTKLTYWDPTTHSAKTVVSATLASVPLPEALGHQNIKDLKRDSGGFVSNYDIVDTPNGLMVADYAELTNEPGGALYDGDDEPIVPVFNRDGKLVICTKNNWTPALFSDKPSYTEKFLSAGTIKTC